MIGSPMNVNNPLISIITVSYNVGNSIEQTIVSVLNQNVNNFEYIVIDGASTDDTIDILKKYQEGITFWLSEPDEGIYDAMNKGIRLAKGKYICFINSGDILYELPVQSLMNSGASLNAFPVKLSNGNVFFPKVNLSLKIKNTLPHQGCFYLKTPDLIFDTNFKVFSDFCLNQKIYKQGKKIEVFDKPIVAYHDMDGISHNKKYGNEIFKVVKESFGLHYSMLSWFYFKKQGVIKRIRNLCYNGDE